MRSGAFKSNLYNLVLISKKKNKQSIFHDYFNFLLLFSLRWKICLKVGALIIIFFFYKKHHECFPPIGREIKNV